ncbi:histone-lysine N-methyltransferase SETMAR [Trichonephila clavipes]|nr:histone-lysine N-methyltransferase SETMAR [Trichonephila clavipes]
MTRRRVENREGSLGYARFVRPVFTKDSKPLWKKEKITRVPRDCDTRTHLKKMAVVSISPEASIKQFQIYARCQGENVSQVAENANDVHGADTATANFVQFWFCRFRLGIFDVKDAPRTGKPVVENVHKNTEIIEVDRYVSNRNITQELKINHKTGLNHMHKVGYKKKLDPELFYCAGESSTDETEDLLCRGDDVRYTYRALALIWCESLKS